MSFRRAVVAVAAILLLTPTISSCKKSVEGETKSWNSNLRRVQRLSTLYPGFRAPLLARQKKAQVVMDAAKKISDKEAAAEKMAEANSVLMGGFVRKLAGIDSKVKRLRTKILSATSAARDKTDRMVARQAAEDARIVLKNTKELLRMGADSATAAATILGKIESDITSARRNLERVIKAVKGKRKAATKAAKVKKQEAAKREAAKRPWKCEYCDHRNPVTVLKCKNCNAPRGK